MIKNKSFTLNFISLITSVIVILSSCQNNQTEKSISFYHWKSHAEYTKSNEQNLAQANSSKIYMHYFDVDQVATPNEFDNGVYPTYVIKDIDSNYRNYEIVPVVYITNQVFKSEQLDIINLADQITDLVHQISLKYFNKEITTIQIDCDWTQSTQYTYFEFLKEIQQNFELDVTIRLHQIKYKNETGVPPVKHGTLMLYNMGDFKKLNENSILESKIVEQYIYESTDYPLTLNLGLPIFSQTILINNDQEFKIIKDVDRNLYEMDSHFEKINENQFKVVIDTLYKGFYLTRGFTLKLEELDEPSIIDSYRLIEKSKLKIDEIILYHLDDKALNDINIKTIIEEL